jgi:hypothetical protein
MHTPLPPLFFGLFSKIFHNAYDIKQYVKAYKPQKHKGEDLNAYFYRKGEHDENKDEP